MAQKSCSKCGQAFQCCNEQAGCWCERYTLDKITLAELGKQYDNCLCEKCLADFSVTGMKSN